MIYIIHTISVLLKTTQITLKITFSNVVSRSIREFHLKKKNKFSQHIMVKSSRLEKDKKIEDYIIKDVKTILMKKKKKSMILQLQM